MKKNIILLSTKEERATLCRTRKYLLHMLPQATCTCNIQPLICCLPLP